MADVDVNKTVGTDVSTSAQHNTRPVVTPNYAGMSILYDTDR